MWHHCNSAYGPGLYSLLFLSSKVRGSTRDPLTCPPLPRSDVWGCFPGVSSPPTARRPRFPVQLVFQKSGEQWFQEATHVSVLSEDPTSPSSQLSLLWPRGLAPLTSLTLLHSLWSLPGLSSFSLSRSHLYHIGPSPKPLNGVPNRRLWGFKTVVSARLKVLCF